MLARHVLGLKTEEKPRSQSWAPALVMDTLASESKTCLDLISMFEGRIDSPCQKQKNAIRRLTTTLSSAISRSFPFDLRLLWFPLPNSPPPPPFPPPGRCLRGCADQTSGAKRSYERKPEVRKSKMDEPRRFFPPQNLSPPFLPFLC